MILFGAMGAHSPRLDLSITVSITFLDGHMQAIHTPMICLFRFFGARPPSNSNSWSCENEAFVRDLSFKFQLKLWKRSFCARPLLQIPVEAVKTILCETSFKFQLKPSWSCENDFVRDLSFKFQLKLWKRSFCARPLLQIPVEAVKTILCETSFKFQLKPSWSCENDFVRDLLQIPAVEAVKTISCETSFKFQQLKLWKRFRARPPSNSSWSCEKEAFVRDPLQIPTVEDVKTKLSCETSLKFPQLRHSGSQTFRHSDFQTFRQSDLQTCRHLDMQTFRHSDSDFQTFRHPDFQTLRLSVIQTFRLSDTQTFKLLDIQTFRLLSDLRSFRQSFHHILKNP